MRQTRGNAVQSIPFADESRDDDARSCPGTTVHASGLRIPISPRSLIEHSPRLLYLLDKIADSKKSRKTQEKHKRYGQTVYETDIRLGRKEMEYYHPPGSNCLLCSSPHAVILCSCRFLDGLPNFSRAAACAVVVVVVSTLFTPMSARSKIVVPSWSTLVQLTCKKPSTLA